MELNDTQPWAVTIAERDALAAYVERVREVISCPRCLDKARNEAYDEGYVKAEASHE